MECFTCMLVIHWVRHLIFLHAFSFCALQEVPFDEGLQMLKAFHAHNHVTSIVDDYAYYDNRAVSFQRSKQHRGAGSYGEIRVKKLQLPRVEPFDLGLHCSEQWIGVVVDAAVVVSPGIFSLCCIVNMANE